MDSKHLIYINNPMGKGKRILFIGGCITIAAKNDVKAWHGGFGMAASKPEADYVHVCMRHINKFYPDSAAAILSSTVWEFNYKTGDEYLSYYDDAVKFKPDIIILQLGDDVFRPWFEKEVYKARLSEFISYINPKGRASLIFMTSYLSAPSDKAVMQTAEEYSAPCIDLSYLSDDENMYTPSVYTTASVRLYPNDYCMKEIAKSLLLILQDYLKQ